MTSFDEVSHGESRGMEGANERLLALSFMSYVLSTFWALHEWNWTLTCAAEAPPLMSSVQVGRGDSADLLLQVNNLRQ